MEKVTSAMSDDARPEIDVLLVEDSPKVQAVMVKVLMNAGYSVHAATDGTIALEQVATHRYRAIVCDLAMPIMGGIQFFQELDIRDPAQAKRVFFITGSGDSPEAIAFFKSGQHAVLEKPYPLKELVRRVAKLVDRPPLILP